jgi:uncharacterized protein (TIGR02453 family)
MKEIFDFLKDLTNHNDRDWMVQNKKRYESAKKTFEVVVKDLITGISAFEPKVGELKPKDCIFRLHRDVRFSKNKAPYKTNFGAAINEGGRKAPNPTYYIHLQPGNSFIAGGVYMPQSEALKKIRQEIDYNPGELKKVIEHKEFAKTWGPLTGESLKTAPQGYPKDHPNIELLRLKSFIVMNELNDDFFYQDDFVEQVVDRYKVLSPLNEYLSVAMS